MQRIIEAAMSGVAHMAADLTGVERETLASAPIDESPPILYPSPPLHRHHTHPATHSTRNMCQVSRLNVTLGFLPQVHGDVAHGARPAEL
jgi:hypothetical protein